MRIISSKSSSEATELERFASWFHQDWKVRFTDFQDASRAYLATLPPASRSILRQQLSDFLFRHDSSSPAKIKKSWLALGAQGYPSSGIMQALEEFVSTI
jgi:hypothetical protein